jgi:hypothetical protein
VFRVKSARRLMQTLGELWSSLLFSHRIQFHEFIPGRGSVVSVQEGYSSARGFVKPKGGCFVGGGANRERVSSGWRGLNASLRGAAAFYRTRGKNRSQRHEAETVRSMRVEGLWRSGEGEVGERSQRQISGSLFFAQICEADPPSVSLSSSASSAVPPTGGDVPIP